MWHTALDIESIGQLGANREAAIEEEPQKCS
jgi:hypothetical protein